ncbi:MAG TPA: ATP-binding protein, partial [Pyrinomonadaceae bacterium]|nr:ATP-binding protein [Pyrinomonadaceae bacterium]
PWERLIYRVLTASAGLPEHLERARSALIVPIGDEDSGAEGAGGGLPPFVVVLSDPRPERFNRQHLQLVREFFSDVSPLVKKSRTVSQRLIKLWAPQRNASGEDVLVSQRPDPAGALEHPDVIETLDGRAALAEEALDVLGVDALQVIQLRRGSIRTVSTGRIDLLAAISLEKGGEHAPIKFPRSVKRNAFVTSKADILWRVFAEDEEYACKEFEGLDPERLARLIPHAGPVNTYRTVLIAPIESEGELAGALLAYRRKQSEFVDIDPLLVRSLAARLGERIELHRKLADRVRLIACLFNVATAGDASAARRALVEGARGMLNSDHVFMMEVKEPPTGRDRHASPEIDEVAHTWEDGQMYVRRIRASVEGITGEVFMSGRSLAVSDVSNFPTYVPIRTPSNRVVKVASELAVPINAPFSAGDGGKRVSLGVIDALWKQPHRITLREVNTLRALAGHAAAVLKLTSGLQVAQHMRHSLQQLLNEAILLQEAKTREDALEWLASTLLGDETRRGLIDCDLLVVWQHVRDSEYMDLLLVRGERAAELRNRKRLKCKGRWTAGVISRFREGGLKSAFDYYDSPAPDRRHIRGTRVDKYQSSVIRCIVPTPGTTGSEREEPHTVWAVSLYKFRESNFNEHDGVLLQFAAEYCEATLQKLHSLETQARSLQLAKASQDVALKMIDSLRANQREVVDYICERVRAELRAARVAIIYYETGTSTAPTYFSCPKTTKQSEPPRRDGLSEAVRALGVVTVVEDVKQPPPKLGRPVRSSPFFKSNREIRAFVAVPLFEVLDDSSRGSFFGVMYVNFAEKYAPSKAELEFLGIMQRFLAECGGIEGKLLHMRAEALQNVHKIDDPGQVFRQILGVTLDTLRSEFPSDVRKNPLFQLGGNLYMVTHGRVGVKLRVRDNIGELSGRQAGVQEIGEGVLGWVAENGQPKLIEDTRSETSLALGYLPYLKDMRSELAVPVFLPNAPGVHGRVAEGVIGVINVECSLPNAFTARHQNLLMRFSASPVALILYLAERHGQRLWQIRQEEDKFRMSVAVYAVHDLTRPMRNLASQVATIRRALPRAETRKIEATLKKMEQESRDWNDLRNTGLHFLTHEILDELSNLDVVEQVRAWAAKCKVRVQGSRVPAFFIPRGHPELIASVLKNLYDNSDRELKKARRKDGRIWITMEVTPEFSETGSYLDIFFHDNGPGVRGRGSETWGGLFRPFAERKHQAPEGRRAADGGWGLGLPMVREMMHLMGGTFDIVDSQPNYQTTFRLRFMAQPVIERR